MASNPRVSGLASAIRPRGAKLEPKLLAALREALDTYGVHRIAEETRLSVHAVKGAASGTQVLVGTAELIRAALIRLGKMA